MLIEIHKNKNGHFQCRICDADGEVVAKTKCSLTKDVAIATAKKLVAQVGTAEIWDLSVQVVEVKRIKVDA